VCAVMHKQVPSISNQRARKEGSVNDQIDERETSPYLPKNCEHRPIGVCMMRPMSRWNEIVQHKPMNEIFEKGPRDDTPDEKPRTRTIKPRTAVSKGKFNDSITKVGKLSSRNHDYRPKQPKACLKRQALSSYQLYFRNVTRCHHQQAPTVRLG
jgi:hypothetical protein